MAATAALILSANPNLTPADVDLILTATAFDLGSPGYDYYFGHGRIDAAGATEVPYARISVENISPAISIISPTAGIVSGNVPLDVSYSDNKGVVRVELYVNGKKVIEDAQSPFAFIWDTTTLTDGNHTLVAYAFDAAENQGTSSPITVTIKNSSTRSKLTATPEIIRFNLTDGQKISQNVNVKIVASNNTRKINLKVNGQTLATSNVNSLNYRWNTWDSAPRGSTLTITVEAVNVVGIIASQSVLVRN